MAPLGRLPTSGLFAALAYRPFALLWLSQVVSRVGDSLTTIALAWWVLEATGSAGSMAQVLIAGTTPQILLLLVGGVVVDRVDRLRLLIVCDVVRCVCIGAIAVLAAVDGLAFWHLIAFSAVFGAAVAFTFPAFTALTPVLVPTEALVSANSLRSLGIRMASIVGPALGGLIVAAGGTAIAFGLDAVTFAVSGTLLLAAARLVSARPTVAGQSGVLAGAAADLREGFATVFRSPWLWVTIALAGVSNLTISGPIQAALPLLVDEELGGSVRVYSLLYAVVATGAVISADWLGQRGRVCAGGG